jgi:hypothetical protein
MLSPEYPLNYSHLTPGSLYIRGVLLNFLISSANPATNSNAAKTLPAVAIKEMGRVGDKLI